jgi:hypothetical protein
MTTTDRITIRSKFRDLNAKGRGTETYRMLATIHADGTASPLYWADQHPDALAQGSQYLPRDTFRAGDRHASCEVEVPLGTGILCVDIDKSIGRGNSTSYDVNWVMTTGADKTKLNNSAYLPLKHCGVKRVNGSYVHVVQIHSRRIELTS